MIDRRHFQARGLAHRIEVAAAISRAGGLGVYAAARDGPDELAGKLAALRQLCPDHPVGVDLLLPTALPEQTTAEAVAVQPTMPPWARIISSVAVLNSGK